MPFWLCRNLYYCSCCVRLLCQDRNKWPLPNSFPRATETKLASQVINGTITVKPGCWTTCDIAAGTAWDTFPILKHTLPTTTTIGGFYAGKPVKLTWVLLQVNFACTSAVKACDGCCCRRRMFSYVGTVSQEVPAAMLQVVRRHMRTRLKSL